MLKSPSVYLAVIAAFCIAIGGPLLIFFVGTIPAVIGVVLVTGVLAAFARRTKPPNQPPDAP
jgi:hypothetical protein